ncbi:hypothetical protein EVAR_61324_1 [Eumeta japonica]|uniref:Uncharacterized protein n=1 Tax=Eumeta variegata TaxID=151549 RepID=A0A4C1Y4S3_EUMVA|nr:hypothetical protein EVAR_61324_1 [Eumeta japonica]
MPSEHSNYSYIISIHLYFTSALGVNLPLDRLELWLTIKVPASLSDREDGGETPELKPDTYCFKGNAINHSVHSAITDRQDDDRRRRMMITNDQISVIMFVKEVPSSILATGELTDEFFSIEVILNHSFCTSKSTLDGRSQESSSRAFSTSNRASEPPESKWSPWPIDTDHCRGVTGALPASWLRIGYWMEGE